MTFSAAHESYQGVWQIARFNWRQYAAGAACVTIAAVLANRLPLFKPELIGGAAMALFWMCSSLLVSHYVYDRSGLYDFAWLRQLLPIPAQHWVNIHAGLDETTHRLQGIFPGSHGLVLDIFDAGEMTESSIAEARRLTATSSNASIRAGFNNLPVASSSCHAVFLLFTAHELRRRPARISLFAEAARIALPGYGRVILLEHQRDLANFLAFGPGFLHFFSAREWRECASSANLDVEREFAVNPFVRAFVLRRAG